MTVVGAVDVGGTHVSAALVDGARRAVLNGTRHDRRLDPHGDRDTLLGALLDAVVGAAGDRGPHRWGVAFPGPFDYARGICTIEGVAKLDALHGVDVRSAVAGALGLADPTAVRFLNDADAFGVGEWWAGTARGHERVLAFTLGTGLGSAFVVDGRAVGEGPGVPPDGSVHLLAFRGAPVEETISRRGLLRAYGAGPEVDVVEVAARARAGEPAAARAVAGFAEALGAFVGPLARAFAPTCVVVGGSMARAWDLLAPRLVPAVRAAPSVQVVTPAALLDDAALLGAAHEVLSRRVA